MHWSPQQSTGSRRINKQRNSSLRRLRQRATQGISLPQHHHPCNNSPSQVLAHSSLQVLDLEADLEDVDAESVQTREDTGVHHLQILWVGVTKVAYPPLEGEGGEAVLRRSHNKMHHVMQRQCIPILLKDMRTGTFVSRVVLILRMDIRPKHAQPPGDAQIIKRDTLSQTLGSILRQDMTRARRRCTSPSSRPCDGVEQNS